MTTKAFGITALTLILIGCCVWSGTRADALQGPGAGGSRPSAPPRPARTPKNHRREPGRDDPRKPSRRLVNVTIVSNLPYCNVYIDGDLEEGGTNEQGRVTIPMEPGVYDVSVAKPGFVTEGREVEVGASSPSQEEPFTLRRALLSLKVKTNPPGAKVSLDGGGEVESDADGLITFKQVDPSVNHTLRGSRENYADESVTVAPYQREAEVRLRRDLLTLRVKTYPPQAEVYLDEDFKGTSDATGVLIIAKVKTGREHSLRASKEGYETRTVVVPMDYELSVIKLPEAGGAAAAESLPASQTAQGEAAQRPDPAAPPRNDAPQAPVPLHAYGTPPAAQNREGGAPVPQQQVVRDGGGASQPNIEVTFWESVRNSEDPEEFAAYLRKYPEGQFVELARLRMNALLANRQAAAATTPTPAATPMPLPTPATTSTPEPAQTTLPAANTPPALGETIDWLSKNFGARFTYRYTETGQAAGGVSSTREASIDFEPLRFEGCRLEWRVFDAVHRVSLSDLDPASVKVELRRPPPGTTYSTDVWSLSLTGAGGKEAFEKMEGGRGEVTKTYWRLVLLYDGKEKAGRVGAALSRAIELCGGKSGP